MIFVGSAEMLRALLLEWLRLVSRGLELKQGREDWNAHFIFKDGIFQALVACRRRAFLEAPRCDRASNFLDLQGRSDAK